SDRPSQNAQPFPKPEIAIEFLLLVRELFQIQEYLPSHLVEKGSIRTKPFVPVPQPREAGNDDCPFFHRLSYADGNLFSPRQRSDTGLVAPDLRNLITAQVDAAKFLHPLFTIRKGRNRFSPAVDGAPAVHAGSIEKEPKPKRIKVVGRNGLLKGKTHRMVEVVDPFGNRLFRHLSIKPLVQFRQQSLLHLHFPGFPGALGRPEGNHPFTAFFVFESAPAGAGIVAPDHGIHTSQENFSTFKYTTNPPGKQSIILHPLRTEERRAGK